MPITSDRNGRCAERTLVNRTVEITCLRNDEMDSSGAKLLDISFCGAGIISHQAYQADENFTLSFSLPNYEGVQRLALQAKVIHSQTVRKQFLTGLVFPELSAHQILVIKAFINFHQRFDA
jgi:hypothetical protein